jgi:hypothetical protein
MRLCHWKLQLAVVIGCYAPAANAFSLSRKASVIPVSIDAMQGVQAETTDDLQSFVPYFEGESSHMEQDDDLEVFVRNEYQQWLSLHDKQADESRYPVFRLNFMAQLNHDLEHQGGAQFSHLNQFGDLTKEEYQREMAHMEQDDDLEVFVRNEYQQWLSLHDKQADESRYPVFRLNFMAQLNHDLEHQGGAQFTHLNQFGDLTKEEYQREMVVCLEIYDQWCQQYGKEHDETKYEVFKVNLVQLSSRSAKEEDSEQPVEQRLTEYADLTQEQFLSSASDELYIKQRYSMWLKDHGKNKGNFDIWKGNYKEQLEEFQQTKNQHSIRSFVFGAYSDLTKEAHDQELQYQQEYHLWCEQFNKEQNSARFEIFKNHQAHLTSPDLAFNKFADLTLGEFATVVSTEAFIQEEFQSWLDHYGKMTGSYEVFQGNYLLQLNELAKAHCVKSFIFDEFSDLTQAEYEKELILRFDYKNWCQKYNKKVSTSRYNIFKVHHTLAVSKNVFLSQDADLTPDEYMIMASDDSLVEKEFQEWLDHYGKKTGHLDCFKANFLLQVEKLKESYSYQSFVFNEYSDLNQQEYEQELEVQNTYRTWAEKHSKVTTNKRYQIFNENHARSLANGMKLNEDADLTQEEFTDMVATKSFMEKEFKEWLDHYGKTEGSFDTFRANYLSQLEGLKDLHCFKPFVFDEHSDKTQEERKWEPVYAREYVAWYQTHGKQGDDARFEVFKKNGAAQIRSSTTNNTKLELTEYADQTKQEFVAMASSYDFIEQQFNTWLQDHEKMDGTFETYTDAFLLNLHKIDHSCQTLKLDQDADKIDVQQAVDSLCRDEYNVWCSKFGKGQHAHRYTMFKVNFVQQLRKTTGMTVQLNEFADKYTHEGFEMERMYQNEYAKWIETFGKSKDEVDYEVFKANFLQQLEYNEKTGTHFALNEFGANTKEEYIQINIRKEYIQWTKDYDKPVDESRFEIFQKNYLQQLKLEGKSDSGRLYHLNELGDKEEWEMESFFREKYEAWAEKYGKEKNVTRYQTFKANLIRQLQYNQENQNCYSINEFGDLTQEEWDGRSSQEKPKKKPAFICDKHAASHQEEEIAQEPANAIAGVEKSDSLDKNAPYFMSNPVQEAENFSFSFGKALKLERSSSL